MVNVQDDGRWTIFTEAPSKGRAIKEAQSLLASGKFDAAKVTEDRGQSQEILLWEEKASARPDKPIKITPIDDVTPCTELEDFYGYQARRNIGRLLRQYFVQEGLLPIELVHDRMQLRQLTRRDDIFIKTIQISAAAIAKIDDRSSSKLIDFLESTAQKMIKRAEKSDSMKEYVEMLNTDGVAGLIKAVRGSAPEDDHNFFIRATLTKLTGNYGDWEGKLIALLDLAEKNPGAEAMEYIDEIIAELFDGSDAVREILGYQRNLATATQTVIQLATGTYEIEEGSESTLERLSRLMGKAQMTRSREVMIDRVVRVLSGVVPLTKAETRPEEQEAFRSIIRYLMGHKLLSNAGALCEAASLRAKSVLVDEHEDESYEKAVDDMISLLPTIAAKLGYLLDLCGTEFGKRVHDHIVACLASLLAGVTTVAQLVERGSSEKEIIVASAGIRDRLLATDLPDAWRQRFSKRIYDLLVGYQQGETQSSISKTANRDEHPQAEDVAEISSTEDAPAADDTATDNAVDKSAGGEAGDEKDSGEPMRRDLIAGETLFNEGDEGNEAYLVLIGQINIIKHAGDQDIVIAQVGKGSIIGEMALIDSEPRMATAKAATDTTVTIIPADDLKMRLDRLAEFDPIMRRLVGMFVQRMRDSRFLNFDS